MFRFFKQSGANEPSTPSLDSVRFDTDGYESAGEPQPGRVRVWFTPDDDSVSLHLFPIPPDLPASARTEAEIGAVHAARLKESGGRVVETSVLRVGGVPAVRFLFKIPKQPTGMVYVGSFTLPFRDFSFVVKVQAEERGITGVRETVLVEQALASGAATPSSIFDLPGWNPDAEAFDAEFPNHPVSRARRVLDRVARSLTIEPAIAGLPGFPLPEISEP